MPVSHFGRRRLVARYDGYSSTVSARVPACGASGTVSYARRKEDSTCKKCRKVLGLKPKKERAARSETVRKEPRTAWDHLGANIADEDDHSPPEVPDEPVEPPPAQSLVASPVPPARDPAVEHVVRLLYLLMTDHMGVANVAPLVSQARTLPTGPEPFEDIMIRARALTKDLLEP